MSIYGEQVDRLLARAGTHESQLEWTVRLLATWEALERE